MKHLSKILCIFFCAFITMPKLVKAFSKIDEIKTISCYEIISSNDCSNEITINAEGRVHFSCLPRGAGNDLEFNNNKLGNKYFFEKEHNTAWLHLNIVSDGLFAFQLYPFDTIADFDFTIYKISSENYCEDIKLKNILPIRTNISRPNKKEGSKTGLTLTANENFVGAGKGQMFSKAIEVTKGEEYILVIDEVTDLKTGKFGIHFKYFNFITLSGKIEDSENGNAIQSDGQWEDRKSGEVLGLIKFDEAGMFTSTVPYEKDNPSASYVISTNKKGYFFGEKTLNSQSINTLNNEQIHLSLTKLKKDANSQLTNINFYPNLDIPVPQSKSCIKRLLKLMKDNPKLSIQIEGHLNGCFNNLEESQKLSENRAIYIMKYLIENGINENRISTIGYNCSRMIYPVTRNEYEEEQNRRVEILVTEY